MNHSTFLIGDTVYENTQSSFLKYSYMVDDSNKQSVSTQSLYNKIYKFSNRYLIFFICMFALYKVFSYLSELGESGLHLTHVLEEKDRKWINHIVNIFGYTSIIVFVFLIVVIVVIIYISRKHYKDAINIKQNLSKFGSKFNLHIGSKINPKIVIK